MQRIMPYLQKLVSLLKRNVVLICIVIFGSMYGFLIYTSSKVASQVPSESKVNEQFQGVSSPKVDEDVANQLLLLEDQNIEVKTLFDAARENPFAE
jgi:hypothetical protein